MDKYFVFHCAAEHDGDGWSIDGPLTSDGVKLMIEEWKKNEDNVRFYDHFPDIEFTPKDGRSMVVIIKGVIVQPKPVKVIEQYEIP